MPAESGQGDLYIEFTPAKGPLRRPRGPVREPEPGGLTHRLPARALEGWRDGVGALPSTTAPQPRRDGRSTHQDEWLNGHRRAGTPLVVQFLAGGTTSGRLIHFDTYCLVLENDGETALLFKHGVAAIRPAPAEAPAP